MVRKLSAFVRVIALFSLIIIGGVYASAASEKVLHSFSPYQHGYEPSAMVADSAGNFYVTALGGSFGQGMVLKFTLNAQGSAVETVLYNFKSGTDGNRPVGLFLDPSGNLYGLTEGGGTGKNGTFFELTPTAHGEWKESILYNFTSADDGTVAGSPVKDASGNFYCTTLANFEGVYGAVLQLVPGSSGWSANILHAFSGGSDGAYPFGKLALDKAGNVYGAAELGGVSNNGLIYELIPSSGGTWSEKVLYSFTSLTDGREPSGAVIFDEAGNLYSTTAVGGAGRCNSQGGCGTVFELTPSAGQWQKSTLYTFGNSSGNAVEPQDLYFDAAGDLYGTTYEGGGDICCGSAFELTPSGGQWTGTTIYTFTGGKGYYPNATIAFGSSGQIYGTTLFGGPAAQLNGTFYELMPSSGEWTFTGLYGFPVTDGGFIYSGLTFDGSGNLYGTANNGGVHDYGIAYELIPGANGGWTESVLSTFNAGQTSNGSEPSSLIFDSAGNLYGAAEFGGNQARGAVFELSPVAGGSWSDTVIDQMGGRLTNPVGNIIFDKAGNLYGTTYYGGTAGYGAVYELVPQGNGKWTQVILYSFTGDPDGANPAAALVMDSAGNLYGTTQKGGNGSCRSTGAIGCGAVFEISPGAGGTWTEKVLYSFQGRTSDGLMPEGNLIFDKNGNLYGTTNAGGIHTKSRDNGCGIVYELSPGSGDSWTETILYEFTDTNGDGASPQAGLVFDSAGNLYGTTSTGGTNPYYGTAYRLSPSNNGWSETILHSFDFTDGAYPYSALILDGSGNLYGTTSQGGTAGYGTVFEVTP